MDFLEGKPTAAWMRKLVSTIKDWLAVTPRFP